MTVQELREQQLNHIAEIGGYWYLQEIDHIYNDLNRAIMEVFRSEHEKAFIGFVNLPDDKLKALQEGQPVSVYEEYVGQRIYDFSCNFIVPEAEEKLESLIKQWNAKDNNLPKGSLMNEIFNRIFFISFKN